MALEWLKGILGEFYTEEIDKAVSAEIGKNFVAKADFNAKNEALKTAESVISERDKQLEALKGTEGLTEDLKKQIADLQTANKKNKADYEEKLEAMRLDAAVERALAAAGAKNNTAVKALLADFLKSAKTAEDGTVKGLNEAVDGLVKDESTAFLFDTKSTPQFSGMKPGDPGGQEPSPSGSLGDYETRLTAARKSGDLTTAIAIKNEAAGKGITLF